jgi:hypothetical protein
MALGDELMFEEIKKRVGVYKLQGCELDGLGGWLLPKGAIILLIKPLIMLI